MSLLLQVRTTQSVDSDPMDIDMMREGLIIEERLKKLVMMGQIDKTVAKKWLQTKFRQKVVGAREKRAASVADVALRKIRRSKRKLARLICKLPKRLRRKPQFRIRKRIQLRIRELREAQNTSKGFKRKYKSPLTR